MGFLTRWYATSYVNHFRPTRLVPMIHSFEQKSTVGRRIRWNSLIRLQIKLLKFVSPKFTFRNTIKSERILACATTTTTGFNGIRLPSCSPHRTLLSPTPRSSFIIRIGVVCSPQNLSIDVRNKKRVESLRRQTRYGRNYEICRLFLRPNPDINFESVTYIWGEKYNFRVSVSNPKVGAYYFYRKV